MEEQKVISLLEETDDDDGDDDDDDDDDDILKFKTRKWYIINDQTMENMGKGMRMIPQ